MRLYTAQPRFVYDILCERGVFVSEPWKDAGEWICEEAPGIRLAYDWLDDEMVERGFRRPAPNVYPLWAWYHYMGAQKPKPDLRHGSMKNHGKSSRQVLLSLDLPDEDVLQHDYMAWHYPLNYFYLAAQRASDRFERRCKAAGASLYDVVPLRSETLHAEVQRSWRTIFDLPACRRLFKHSRANQAIQATFWELHASHVTAVMEFGGGEKRQALPLPRVIDVT